MSRHRTEPLSWRHLLRRRSPALFLIVVVVLAVVRWYQQQQPPPRELPQQSQQEPPQPGRFPEEGLAEGVYSVDRVVDGDTLLLANRARIRLQGVDTPETVKPDHPVEPFGREASQFTKRFVDEAGGKVRLRFGRERVDDYGRLLAFVFSDDLMLNEELVRAGLATAETQYRYSSAMKTRLRKAEEEAKAARRGIWSQ